MRSPASPRAPGGFTPTRALHPRALIPGIPVQRDARLSVEHLPLLLSPPQPEAGAGVVSDGISPDSETRGTSTRTEIPGKRRFPGEQQCVHCKLSAGIAHGREGLGQTSRARSVRGN